MEFTFPKWCIPFDLSLPGPASSAPQPGLDPNKNPTPKNDKEDKPSGATGELQSKSGADSDDGVDATTTPLETYNFSNDVLGLDSDQNPDYKFAENQGVQLADNLGASSKYASTSVAAVPPSYQLTNDYLDVQGNHQSSDLFTGATPGVQLIDGLFGAQNPSSENSVASSSGPDFALGSLPSSTDIGGSNTDFQAFALDHNSVQNTNQYTASLQAGGK